MSEANLREFAIILILLYLIFFKTIQETSLLNPIPPLADGKSWLEAETSGWNLILDHKSAATKVYNDEENEENEEDDEDEEVMILFLLYLNFARTIQGNISSVKYQLPPLAVWGAWWRSAIPGGGHFLDHKSAAIQVYNVYKVSDDDNNSDKDMMTMILDLISKHLNFTGPDQEFSQLNTIPPLAEGAWSLKEIPGVTQVSYHKSEMKNEGKEGKEGNDGNGQEDGDRGRLKQASGNVRGHVNAGMCSITPQWTA